MLGTEKVVVSEMTVPGCDRRVYTITKQIGMVMTGLVPDGRALAQRAKDESASFQEHFGIPITGKALADRLAQYMHMNTMTMWSRPYGCTVIIASFDDIKGPALYQIDSAGQCYGYFGCSAGKGRQLVRNEIEKLTPKTSLTCRDAVFNVAKM